MTPATPRQRQTLIHSLGLDIAAKPYRNRYLSPASGPAADRVNELIGLGLMVRGETIAGGDGHGQFYAHVSRAGFAVIGVEVDEGLLGKDVTV